MIQVDIVIDHPVMTDLSATLTGPTGFVANLVYASGEWIVEPGAFAGDLLDGTWTLTLSDDVKNGATGTLQNWSLIVTPAAGASAAGEAMAADVTLPTDLALAELGDDLLDGELEQLLAANWNEGL